MNRSQFLASQTDLFSSVVVTSPAELHSGDRFLFHRQDGQSLNVTFRWADTQHARLYFLHAGRLFSAEPHDVLPRLERVQ